MQRGSWNLETMCTKDAGINKDNPNESGTDHTQSMRLASELRTLADEIERAGRQLGTEDIDIDVHDGQATVVATYDLRDDYDIEEDPDGLTEPEVLTDGGQPTSEYNAEAVDMTGRDCPPVVLDLEDMHGSIRDVYLDRETASDLAAQIGDIVGTGEDDEDTPEVAPDGGVVQEDTDAEVLGIGRDEVYHLLSCSRRRHVIRLAADADNGETVLSDLAETIACREDDVSLPELDAQDRKRVYINLSQNHLPKLDDKGVIDLGDRGHDVSLTETGERLCHAMQMMEPIFGGEK